MLSRVKTVESMQEIVDKAAVCVKSLTHSPGHDTNISLP